MARWATSASWCMVSITMRVLGRREVISRVAATPSMNGIVTSIKTTSGRSAIASRTASSPLAASAMTSKRSSSSKARRSPWRSIVWSSANNSRIFMVVLSARRHYGSDGGAPTWLRADLETGTDAGGPLTHAEQSEGIGAGGVGCETHAVVGDFHRRRAAIALPPHHDSLRLAMAFNVCDRLFGDSPEFLFLKDRQSARAVHIEPGQDARSFLHPIEERAHDRGGITLGGKIGPQVVERVADLADDGADIDSEMLEAANGVGIRHVTHQAVELEREVAERLADAIVKLTRDADALLVGAQRAEAGEEPGVVGRERQGIDETADHFDVAGSRTRGGVVFERHDAHEVPPGAKRCVHALDRRLVQASAIECDRLGPLRQRGMGQHRGQRVLLVRTE